MPLLMMMTLYIPICSSLELLYVCNTIDLFVNLFSSVLFVCRKSILYILTCFKLPSVPVFILYQHVSVLWLLLLFSFAVISDLMLQKKSDFTAWNLCFATSVSSLSWCVSWTAPCLCLVTYWHFLIWFLNTCLKWLALQHPAQLLPQAGNLHGL